MVISRGFTSWLVAGLALLALWMAFDNPEIDGTSRGDDYTCLAPWDTVLNRADNVPGGEPAPDGKSIGTRCRDLGEQRFTMAAVSGGLAVALSIFVLTRRGRARSSPG